VILSVLGFAACFLALGQPWVLHLFGAVALTSAILVVTVAGPRLSWPWQAPGRDLVIGLAAGLAMTGLTYPAHALVTPWSPWLTREVSLLYAGMRPPPGHQLALLWIPIVAVVEELLWRGAVPQLLGQQRHPRRALALSLALYALAQAASGSVLVVVLGLCCGAVWSALRHHSRGLWAPIICHLLWSTIVLGAWPLR
jgi:membrane protease YdiL (CAAX protease family)